VCSVSQALCSLSNEHYTDSGNSLVSDEEKGKRALTMRVSYLKQREMWSKYVRLTSEAKGLTLYEGVSNFYLTTQKGMSIESSPPDPPSACVHVPMRENEGPGGAVSC
jgi:hypothetical protein